MKWLEVLLVGEPSAAPVTMVISLPDDGPDAPAELVNPHGFGRRWQRRSAPDVRPAVYALVR